ncbi:MAG: cytochrome c [Epsilonproteobacteria bacterium]|nr:cytochrome c [Campylobacterota bacterium]
MKKNLFLSISVAGIMALMSGCLATSPNSNEASLNTASATTKNYSSKRGEQLFKQHCVMCHSLSRPEDRSKMVAPTIAGVMFHIKEKYPNKEDAVRFIVDYVRSPSYDKAVCPSVQRFGLMPPLNLPQEDLEAIASYLYDNFPPEGFKHRGGGMFRR